MAKNLNAPSADAIKAAREAASLTTTQAAELIGVTARAWQRYEAGDREMAGSAFELFQLKAASILKVRKS